MPFYKTINNRKLDEKVKSEGVRLGAKETTQITPRMETQTANQRVSDEPQNVDSVQRISAQRNYRPAQQYGYDPSSNAAYQNAMSALEQAKQNTPSYAGTYDQQILDLYNEITNRPKFSYDLNADALYNQYKNQYTQQGRLAMMDTMGQAAALTGGYGSSYGQNVGQQAYQGYLQQLNDVVPELYGQAYDRYAQEGQDMLNRYGMLGAMRDDEYARYQDAVNQHWQNINYMQGRADDAYQRGYDNWYTNMQMQYQKGRDAIEDERWKTQYEEDKRRYDQEWAEDMRRYEQEWAASQARSYSGGGGGSSKNSTSLSDSQMNTLWKTMEDGGENAAARYLESLIANGNIDEDTAAAILASLLDEYEMGDQPSVQTGKAGSDGTSPNFAGSRKNPMRGTR